MHNSTLKAGRFKKVFTSGKGLLNQSSNQPEVSENTTRQDLSLKHKKQVLIKTRNTQGETAGMVDMEVLKQTEKGEQEKHHGLYQNPGDVHKNKTPSKTQPVTRTTAPENNHRHL